MIPTGPKPAWVRELETSQALLAAYERAHGPYRPGTELMFTLDGTAYAAIEQAPHTYTVLGPQGHTTITTSASLREPEHDAPDAEWDAYLQASDEFHSAVRAAAI